jgi:hypothetical protein
MKNLKKILILMHKYNKKMMQKINVEDFKTQFPFNLEPIHFMQKHQKLNMLLRIMNLKPCYKMIKKINYLSQILSILRIIFKN